MTAFPLIFSIVDDDAADTAVDVDEDALLFLFCGCT
jgi:hypothetical protein